MTHTIYRGHDPSIHLDGHEGEGTDLLLQVYDGTDGAVYELAVRPGLNCTWLTWSPPTELAATL
jgi:hypothetical protein